MPNEPRREPKVGDKLRVLHEQIDLTLKVVDVKEEKSGYWLYCETAYKVAGIKSFAWDAESIIEADWL